MICCGNARIVAKIARDSMTDEERPNGAEQVPSAATDGARVQVEVHRTLPPVLRELKRDGFELVGLEQTTHSESLFTFRFARRTALVVGNERTGLTEDELRLLDRVTEIPVFGLPYSLNVATAASMALYEYCRQFPSG
jgi:tRNA G18 (ribose-2'-O)-methylase SpoU